MKSVSQIEYVGNELELFKNAINWKNYFSGKLLPFIKGDVLEVGAGIGINTPFLSQNNDSITSWCCLEPDKELAEKIDSNTNQLNLLNCYTINGIIDDLEDSTFDTIIYIDVLEHIEESTKEIEKIKLRLNNGGHLIILVPAYNFLYNNFDKKIGHFRRYNKSCLTNEVNNRLKKKKLFYLDSVGFFASLANKLVLKKELPSEKNVLFWDKYLVSLSKFFDILFFKSFGKSLIGVYRNEQ